MKEAFKKEASACIHTAFFDRAAIDGCRDVLVDENSRISAVELVGRIETVASHLIAREASGRVVGLLTHNTIDAVVGYFACLHAGAIVASLPRGAPAVVSQIIDDGNVAMVLTDQKDDVHLEPKVAVLEMDRLTQGADAGDAPEAKPDRPAHLLFTSGTTTGKPRAVITDHVGSMLSHAWRTSLWPYEPHDVVGCNIFGMWDVVPALHAGVPAVLLSDRTIRDPLSLSAALTSYGITRMMLTPTLLDSCLRFREAVTALSRLRLLVLCGEAVSPSLHARMKELLPCTRIVNLYSLSECHDVAAGDFPNPGQSIELSTAPFARIFIAEEENRQQSVASQTVGRILVGGPGLADPVDFGERENRGFFKFALEDAPAVNVYDTGDRGRITENGSLEVLGRCESSVKVRGTWVSPSDVEAILQSYPGVARACVSTTEDAMEHLSLLAHIVPDRGESKLDIDELYDWLRKRIHPAAVPGQIVLKETLPLLASGKVDRRRLLQPELETENARTGKTGSMTEEMVEAYRKALGRSDITSEATFNNIGGDSLAAVALCVEIERRTGHYLTPAELKPTDTPAALATRLQAKGSQKPGVIPVRPPILSPIPSPLKKRTTTDQTIFVTGATGSLGRQLVSRLASTPGIRVLTMVRSSKQEMPTGVRTVHGDLSLPQFGWSAADFDDLATTIDTIIHLAADVNMLAPYAKLQEINIMGTERIIQLAARANAPLVMTSSSAVFPLHFGSRWPESFYGYTPLSEQRNALIASGADGYSLTKHDAELLAWQARDKGVPVHLVRIPHLLTPDQASRLSYVASAWAESGYMPEGPWQWQFAAPETVAMTLQAIATDPITHQGPVTHEAMAPLSDKNVQEILASLGYSTRMTTLPACAHALSRQKSLAPLIQRYGPAAAMCINEPVMENSSSHSKTKASEYLRLCLRELITRR